VRKSGVFLCHNITVYVNEQYQQQVTKRVLFANDRENFLLVFAILSWSCSAIKRRAVMGLHIYLVLIDQQSVGKRSPHLMDTVNTKKDWPTIL
jgi:hypothetical protein